MRVQAPVITRRGARRAPGTIARAIVRLVGIALFADGSARVALGHSVVEIPPLRDLRWLARAEGAYEPRSRVLETLIGVGEAVAALFLWRAAPITASEIAETVPSTFDRLSDWLDRQPLAAVTEAIGARLHRAPREIRRVLVIGRVDDVVADWLRQNGDRLAAIVVVDSSPSLLDRARVRLAGMANATFVQRDLRSEPLPGTEYDLIVGNWTIALPGPPPQLVRAAGDVLGRRGTAILAIPTDPGTLWSRIARPLWQLLGLTPTPVEAIARIPNVEIVATFGGGQISVITARPQD